MRRDVKLEQIISSDLGKVTRILLSTLIEYALHTRDYSRLLEYRDVSNFLSLDSIILLERKYTK